METLKFRRISSGKNMATIPIGSTNSGSNTNNNSHHTDSDVDSLELLSTCWSQNTGGSDYLIDSQKLILENAITSLAGGGSSSPDINTHHDNTEIAIDSLLLNSQSISNSNLAELKPLPPFTNYTANLSINGIQGHHYHAIAQQRIIPEENNNNYQANSYTNEHNIVSSSTCAISADSVTLNQPPDSSVKTLYAVEDCVDSGDIKLEYSDCIVNPADSCVVADSPASAAVVTAQQCAVVSQIVKNEMSEYDISSIDDIAAIIGSAIADTTVPNNNQLTDPDDPNASRDSWMDLDAWIQGAVVDTNSSNTTATQQHTKNLIVSQDGSNIAEFILPHSPEQSTNNNNEYCIKGQSVEYNVKTNNNGSTLQSLLTHGYMPLLQNRLQNGPPVIVKQEAPSSTSFGDLISTSSPPANVVSTTDNVLLNGRYIQHYGVLNSGGLADDRIRSPDMLSQNYPHTTSTTPTTTMSKKSRNRSQKKTSLHQSHHQQQNTAANQQHHATSSSSNVFTSEQTLGLLGKEKPVHRCHICNRGFLNKSNIKVHLRTHTGEKPFRCETCAKAFRQKAHLIKHQQIHKRIGRD